MVETLSQLFINTVRTYPKDDLLMVKKEGRYVPISTADFGDGVKHLSLGLRDLGLGPDSAAHETRGIGTSPMDSMLGHREPSFWRIPSSDPLSV